MKLLDIEITENKKIANDIYLLSFDCEYIANNFKPGNFVNILVENGSVYPLLRRPFGICFVDNKTIYIGYKVVGIGTRLLSQKKKGQKLNILAPLGNSFPLFYSLKSVIIGGGVGIFPLLGLACELKKKNNTVDVFLGFKDKDSVFFIDEFKKVADNVYISTDDGSLGQKGNIIDYFKNLNIKYDVVYSCGPKPMLKALQDLNIQKCYISLEEKMACGIGACLCCSIKGKGEKKVLHVCSDGPVFNIMEVDL